MVIHWHAFLLLRSCCPTDPADDKVYIHKQSAAALPRTAFPSSSLSKSLLPPPPSFFPYSAASLTLPACTDFSRYTAFPSPFLLHARFPQRSEAPLYTHAQTHRVFCASDLPPTTPPPGFIFPPNISLLSLSPLLSLSLSCCLSPSLPLPLSL